MAKWAATALAPAWRIYVADEWLYFYVALLRAKYWQFAGAMSLASLRRVEIAIGCRRPVNGDGWPVVAIGEGIMWSPSLGALRGRRSSYVIAFMAEEALCELKGRIGVLWPLLWPSAPPVVGKWLYIMKPDSVKQEYIIVIENVLSSSTLGNQARSRISTLGEHQPRREAASSYYFAAAHVRPRAAALFCGKIGAYG